MKSTIYKSKKNQTKPFPKLMSLIDNGEDDMELVVLFYGKPTGDHWEGTIMYERNTTRGVGEVGRTFAPELFEDFEGQITLFS